MTDPVQSAEAANESVDRRIRCFEHHAADRAFETSVINLMSKMQEKSRKMFVSEQNVLRMNHGSSWVHSAREPEPDTSMHTISAEWLIPFKGIADNDLSLIASSIVPINDQMEKQFAENMYGVIGAAAEKVGNVVSAQAAGSFGHSMLEMISKIELGVDRDGNVSMPQMHVGPDFYARLPEEISKVPPEISAEIERVKVEKIQAALERETERKSKFKQATE